MRPKLWFGTQHHAQWVDAPLSGAEMSPEGWGAEGTYLSGGGFVRQSQDSHRQYIFEWSGASSRESAEIMQAYRDGVYSKSRSDLIYFIDPLIYSRNILPKRWAQPGILAPDSGAASTPLGLVSKIDGPGVLGLPLTGAQVSGYFTSLAMFDATTTPQAGSIWLPVPPGETLHLVAWTEFFPTQESGLYVKAQNLDGSWMPAERVEDLGVEVSGARGVLLASVGLFNYFGARAVIGRGDGWADPAEYAWTGTPNESTSTRTTADGTVTNLFTNPDMQATDGEVVVWENLLPNSRPFELNRYTALRGDITFEGDFLRLETTSPLASPRIMWNDPADLIPVTPGEVYTFTAEVRADEGEQVALSTYMYGADGASVRLAQGTFIPATGDWQPLVFQVTPAEGEEKVGLWWELSKTSVGKTLDVRRSLLMQAPVALPYFDETFSPDPDLTPQPRPGGGSQLVGQRVAGITSFGELIGDPGVAIVQSTQWSKSGGASARIITNKDFSAEEPLAQLFATLISMFFQPSAPSGSVCLWVRQDSEIGELELPPEAELGSSRTVIASFEDYGGEGELIPNGPGEGIVRVFADTPHAPNDIPSVQLFAGANIGDSIWLDLVTITDTEEYEGPPFSGSSPDEGPEWLPGLGHSGCAFVGNPTWAANSGVNGGQVGYAATLKEVGDWQQ